jgi:NAD(P)-dependent dehydrogenase (short-subunit alcohol dehydrogenase family)
MSYIKPDFDLRGRRAIVTGGAGLLGRQFVATLADAGAQVTSVDLKELDVLSIDKECRDNIRSFVVNAMDENDVREHFLNEYPVGDTPTILVNCAGIDTRPDAPASDNGKFEDYSEATWSMVIDSHLKSAFVVSRELFRRFPEGARRGSIINISSTYGLVSPDQSIYQYRRDRGETFYKPAAYTVAKAGMVGFTKWLAGYGAPLGIRANTLVPGGVYANQDEAFRIEYKCRTMLGHMASPSDYNGALLFLASDASSYMTGAELVVDGGWTAR